MVKTSHTNDINEQNRKTKIIRSDFSWGIIIIIKHGYSMKAEKQGKKEDAKLRKSRKFLQKFSL